MSMTPLTKTKIAYLDLDGVCADLATGIKMITGKSVSIMDDHEVDKVAEDNPQLFENLPVIHGTHMAIMALELLGYDVYFASTPMWSVPASWSGKRIWIERNFGTDFKKKLILTHRKDLLIGNILVDDRPHKNGAGQFKGTVITFLNWDQAMTEIQALPENAEIVNYGK